MEINQLSEVNAHRDPNCKWFRNSILDLTVEYSAKGEIKSFHIECNDRSNILSAHWVDFQLRNYVFDDGEADPRKNRTPIAKSELMATPSLLKRKFEMYSLQIPTDIRNYVLSKI